MDVNVWGVARVTKAMIPLMRTNGGRINSKIKNLKIWLK